MTDYTYDEVWRAINKPGNTLIFKYEWLDREDLSQGFLTRSITSFEVNYQYLATVKRTAKIGLVESADEPIDHLNDRIRPWVGVPMPDGGLADFPQGVFLLNSPERTADGIIVSRDISGFDKAQAVMDSSFGDQDISIGTVTIPAGTVYTDQIVSLLQQAAITSSQIKIVDSERQTLVDRTWTAATRRSGQLQIAAKVKQENALKAKLANNLKVINTLISQLHYEDLWFDGFGYAHVEPYIEPSEAPVNHVYEVDQPNILTPNVKQNLDLFSVPNIIVFCISQPDKPMLVSKWTNNDPDSPTSTVSRGRKLVLFDAGVDAASQAELDGLVRKAAIEAANIYEHVTIETMINPMHSNRDIIQLTYPPLGISDLYTEIKWGFKFEPGAIMTHELRRLVNLNKAVIGDPDA